MPRGEKPPSDPPPRACCLVSEVLEEAGVDRASVRKLRRQLLEGMILFCRWQLERMDAAGAPARPPRRARKVAIE